MSEQSSQPLLPPPSWVFLARGKREKDTISRCPEGHIHLDYGNLTLRFEPEEFLTVVRMVAEAAAHLQGISLNKTHVHVPRSSVTFSLN